MKIDRLYAITLYLMNHGRTTAGRLAEVMEVSVRTIRRDMDTLCSAGVPVISFSGNCGGYALDEHFCLDRHWIDSTDFSNLLTALQGMLTATADRTIDRTLEKLRAMPIKRDNTIVLDFSILQECETHYLQLLREAATKKICVQFKYTNQRGELRTHRVEPIAVIYRWYAWYLLAYSTYATDYRTYKLVRMSDLMLTEKAFDRAHQSAEEILEQKDSETLTPTTRLILRCTPAAEALVREYLHGRQVSVMENKDLEFVCDVVESEFFWFGALMATGDSVEVLSPAHIRERRRSAAHKILSCSQSTVTRCCPN